MKRNLILILALLLAVALPLSACRKKTDPEQEALGPSEGLEYVSNLDGTCYVSGIGCCTDTVVVIPATSPAGDRVTGVGREAFKDLTTLTGILLPAGVTSIGNRAFSGCTALQKLQIPNSIATVGLDAFDGCAALQYNGNGNAAYLGNAESPYSVLVKAAATSISRCTIQPGTKVIYACAFKDCANLKTLSIPQSVVDIGNQAFSGSGLTSVTIPSGVTKIEFGTFYGCYALSSVEIPASVTEIGRGAFSYCTALTQITIPDSVTAISERMLSGCGRLINVLIPKSVTSIGNNAFTECFLLEKLTYSGTQAEWEAVNKGTDWDSDAGKSTEAKTYLVRCSDGDITE